MELTEEQEKKLKSHLDLILTNHDGERQPFIEDLIRYQKDYWAKPVTEKRTFPFTGAASIVIPLTAIAFETVHARTMTQLFGLRQYVSVKPVNPAFAPVVTPFEQYFDHELKHSIKFKKNIESSIIELSKLGTGVTSTYYENQIKWGVREVSPGVEEEFPVTTDRGARVASVPLSRFMVPFESSDVELASWCGEEHSITTYDLYLKEQSELFYEGTYEALKFWYTNPQLNGYSYERSQQELEHRTPFIWGEGNIEFCEFWFAYDLEDTGRQREIIVYYHRESRMIMGARDNFNFDLRRKYRTGVYFPVEHRLMGIGIAKQNEQFQREVTTQHRQRLDNATLANMRMIKISNLSSYGPKEPVFPGKMWFLDDMTQIETFQLGEIYPSSYNNEQQTLMYSQQRTGVNEVVLGMPQQGTPGTATGDLTRVQEGRKKFDYSYGNAKTLVDETLSDLLLLIAQYGPSSMHYFENIESGDLVQAFLTAPPELIKRSLLLEIQSAGERESNQLDRQNWMQISQILQQYYTGTLQIAAQLGSPELMQMISMKALSASTEAMKQILESFELKNIKDIVLSEFLNQGGLIGRPQQLLGPGGNPNPQGPSQLGGMGNPSQIIQPA